MQHTEALEPDEWRSCFEALPAAERSRHRSDLVLSGLGAGLTLQELGDLFGVSRERIRQIAKERGVSTKKLREEQRERAMHRRQTLARHIHETSLAHPELTVAELAEWHETDESTVRAALKHRLAVHEARPYSGDTDRTSDDALLTALATWGAQTTTHTSDDYTAWAIAHGYPGKQTPMNRFGGWNNALLLAGLGEHVQDRGGPRPQISDETMWASVLQFYRDDLPSYSFGSYNDYARRTGLPSGAAVRIRLGSWSQIHERIHELLRYATRRDGSWEWAENILGIVPDQEPRRISSRAESLASLIRVAERTTGPITVAFYERHRERQDAQPAVIQLRCGSWVEALRDAGLEHRMSSRARARLQEYDGNREIPGNSLQEPLEGF